MKLESTSSTKAKQTTKSEKPMEANSPGSPRQSPKKQHQTKSSKSLNRRKVNQGRGGSVTAETAAREIYATEQV